jgi:hypothetical protein
MTIDIRDGISDEDALYYVLRVIRGGRKYGEYKGRKLYSVCTDFMPSDKDYDVRVWQHIYRKKDCFAVYKVKRNEHV